MKKSIKFLLSFLLVTTLLTACKSEQDTAFVGRWAGASEEGKLFNKRVLYGVELELERGDLDLETVKSLSLNNSKATLSVSINGVVFINAEGKWSADDKKINFDFGNPDYVNAYFECMRHQSEDDGVDFWWTDGFPENASAMVKADIP